MQDRHRGERPFNRRIFLKGGIIFGGAAIAGVGLLHGAETEKKGDEQEAEVGPPEDLMREHGVLKRVLLIYGEALRRLDAKQDLPPEALADAAGIIRHFVEDYHEKLEEDFSFPRFEKANQLVDLVKALRTQHQAGRRVTDITLRFANLQSLRNESERAQLIASMQHFPVRMHSEISFSGGTWRRALCQNRRSCSGHNGPVCWRMRSRLRRAPDNRIAHPPRSHCVAHRHQRGNPLDENSGASRARL